MDDFKIAENPQDRTKNTRHQRERKITRLTRERDQAVGELRNKIDDEKNIDLAMQEEFKKLVQSGNFAYAANADNELVLASPIGNVNIITRFIR